MLLNGIVSEVPYEVLFCHAIASGNVSRAKALFPHVDLFKRNDLGITAALFCSWAAYTNDAFIAIQTLHEYFPGLDDFKKEINEVDIAETLREVVLPKETFSSSWVSNLLMNISAIDPIDIRCDKKTQQFVSGCCVAALKFILDINHGTFDGISPKIREVAHKLLQSQWLQSADEEAVMLSSHHHAEPDSLQVLMTFLDDEETATKAEAHFLHHGGYTSKTPCPERILAATQALKLCRQECEEENLLEHHPQLGSRARALQ